MSVRMFAHMPHGRASWSVLCPSDYGVVTMTTVGYGDADLLPETDGEKAYTVFFMLVCTQG
jgi:hypothetical protein